MNDDYTEGESWGAKALMFAMIAGAALLFLEVTWSPVIPTTPQTAPVAQTAVHHERLARN